MSASKTKKKIETDAGACADGPSTFQMYPLLQVKDEDPQSNDVLEILLRHDSVRFAIYHLGDEGFAHSLHVSPTDFEAFVECGRAHSFAPTAADPAADPALRENPLILIASEKQDSKSYLEILLRPDGASFALTACDRAGDFMELMVRVSPQSFRAIVDRGRTHRFEAR